MAEEAPKSKRPKGMHFLEWICAGKDYAGRLRYRTATKSTLICFHSMQKGLGVSVRVTVPFGSLSRVPVCLFTKGRYGVFSFPGQSQFSSWSESSNRTYPTSKLLTAMPLRTGYGTVLTVPQLLRLRNRQCGWSVLRIYPPKAPIFSGMVPKVWKLINL